MEWLILLALAVFGALLIKLAAPNRDQRSEIRAGLSTYSNKPRLEPSVKLPTPATPSINYQTKKFILSQAEQAFYKALQQGLSDQFRIMIKVRVADVLQPEKSSSKSEWYSAFNRIKLKHFDFLLCSLNTYRIIAAIELDDRSYMQTDRIKSDKFLNTACESANFPLIRISCRNIYNSQEIKTVVLSGLRDYRLNKAA
jgi:hypothetical protein